MSRSRRVLVLTAGVLTAVAGQLIAAEAPAPAQPAPAPAQPTPMGNAAQAQEGADTAVTTTVFTVQKVDPANRTVTLKAADGATREVKCGPEVRNFDQIKVGDQVAAAVTEDIAVDVRPGGGSAGPGETQITNRAPQGEKPGGVMVQTEEMAGKVSAIDPAQRMISLQDASGMDKTIKVRPNIDLSQIKKGDEVTVRFIRATAIMVGSPQGEAQPAAATMPAK